MTARSAVATAAALAAVGATTYLLVPSGEAPVTASIKSKATFVAADKWSRRATASVEAIGLTADRKPSETIRRWDSTITITSDAPLKAAASVADVAKGKRFPLASGDLEWLDRTGKDALAEWETTPGELAHLCEHGARVSRLTLAEIPADPTWTHTLQADEGTQFIYQPELSESETEAGAIRPLTVVGSYAVFDAAGCKIAHVLRPVAIGSKAKRAFGSKAKRAWGTITITATDATHWRSVVSFDKNDLGALTLPITLYGLDSLGYTTIGGSILGWFSSGALNISQYGSPSVDGTTDRVYVVFNVDPGAWTGGVYDATPSSLIVDTGGGAGTADGSWKYQTTDTAASLTHGISYGVAMCFGGAGKLYYDSSVSGAVRWNKSITYSSGVLPNPVTGLTGPGTGVALSLYVTFAAGGGGPSAAHALDASRFGWQFGHRSLQ